MSAYCSRVTAFVSLSLSYILIVLLCTPFVVSARTLSKPAAATQEQVPARYRDGEILVRFRDGVSAKDKETIRATHGVRRKQQLEGDSGFEKLELPAGRDAKAAVLQLLLNPQVQFAEPNFLISKEDLTPNDPQFNEQWALQNTGQNGGQFGSDIKASAAWDKTTGSASTVIAVIDSGIDFTHPDLATNQWTNPKPSSKGDLHGWDFTSNSAEIKDEQGHGTAMAGIIAAEGNNSVGISGVMWRASLMSLRVLDNTGTGDIANAVQAIDYAVTHGAHVINLSWGTTAESLALKDAIERAIRKGVVVVCSAGNNGQDLSSAPYYPASFASRDLISVAATDHNDSLASWSNWGTQSITIAAPGTDILTTQLGGGYGVVNGTSVSAAIVSGVAGLLKSVRPAANPHTIFRALNGSARKTASLADRISSGGVVDAATAIEQLAGANNQNPNTGSSPSSLPPALRPDNSEGRGNDHTGLSVAAPPATTGAPGTNLPALDQSRKARTSPETTASAPIQANLMCADCDPGGGGGAGGSDPYFGTARTRRTERTGEPNVVTLGSRNFNWSVPIVNLTGRAGLDLSLSLFYNSLVWTKQGSVIQFNGDHGTPAPGFQLGLPRLQSQFFDTDESAYAYIMITPSGGRVQMKQVGSTNVYESTDSTYTQLTFSGSTPIVRTTDGTQFQFGVLVAGEYRCTRIQDRNGNYISATYNTSNGHLQTITDTLGRVVTFNYNGDNNLSTITQTWAGATHTWASFTYATLTMSFSFSGLTPIGAVNNGTQSVLSDVTFADNGSYHFDYNSYGQVYQLKRKAPDGHELAHTLYTIDTAGVQDCPRVRERREYAQDWNNGQEAVTTYSVTTGATWTNPETGGSESGTLVQETAPDGTVYKEYSHASGWDAGLQRLSEFWSGGVKKKWISTTWTQDNTGVSYPINPRVTEINTRDDASNRKRVTVSYYPTTSFSLVSDVSEYAANATTVLRRRHTEYNLHPLYVDRRIIGLPTWEYVYDGSNNIVSKVLYSYDWDTQWLVNQGAATQHDDTNYPASFIVGRGNMVQIDRFDAQFPNDSSRSQTVLRRGFNTAGSVIFSADYSWHRTDISYADSFSDGVNRNTFAYPTSITNPDGYATTTKYNYDFGAVTQTHTPTSGIGGSVTYLDVVQQYDSVGRVDRVTNQTNGAYTRFVYETNANYLHTYQTIIDLTQATEAHSWQIMDGAGRTRASASDHPGSTGGYRGQVVIYDNMGRPVQRSNSTEMNSSWAATGDDSAWVYTVQSYDWQGRPSQTTNPDGSTKVVTYGGCGCAGGDTTTIQDEHGRRRRLTKDSLDRLVSVQELVWDGSVYATTTYAYDTLDQMTGINQAGQTRSFTYDGHGRLQTRTTPEQGTTTYSYFGDDTVQTVTDARGATTTFAYNNRHLPTSMTYGVPAGVAATSNVSFEYDSAGNRTRMLYNNNQGQVIYHYNNLSQLTSEDRYFGEIGATYTTSYQYNLAGKLSSVTNPWGAQVGYNYDKTGRVNAVTGSGYAGVSSYVSSLTYRAFGGVKGMTFVSGKTLSTAYDNRLRLTTWNVSNVLGYNYNYNYFNEKTGRVTYAGSIYDSSLDRSYEYDHVGRLVFTHSGAEARAHAFSGQWGTMDGPFSLGFEYDVWGNMTHRYGWGGEVQGGAAGQSSDTYIGYTNNKRNGFSFDAAGNLTFDLGQTFTYDATGQQATASYGGYSLQQGYDADGLRFKKTENGDTTYYLRSAALGGQVIAEIKNWGSGWNWYRGYVYLGGQLLAVQFGGSVKLVHEDPIVKSKRITDTSGAIVSTIELDPWGADTNRSNNAAFQPKKFTSYERDGNGSDEAMIRRYNRWHSRFDQPDPYEGSYDFTNPQSLNRYAYVQNDPVNATDPSGLMMSFCGAEYSFNDCGGAGGFWGGEFGGHVAAYNREYGGLSPHIAEGLAEHNQRIQNSLDANRANAAYQQWQSSGSAADLARFNEIMRSNPTLQMIQVFSEAQLAALALISLIFGQAIGDQARFGAVAQLTGLSDYILDYTYNASDRTFNVNFKAGVNDFLDKSPYFAGPGLALLHWDIGRTDFRSFTYLTGGLSLQIVPGRNLASSYADFDKINPYEGFVSFLRHNIPIIGRRIGRLFK